MAIKRIFVFCGKGRSCRIVFRRMKPGGPGFRRRSIRHPGAATGDVKRNPGPAHGVPDYVAGRHWQAAWENAAIGGVRAIDPTREAVDGGRLPELLTYTQRRAVQDLKAAREALGREGHLLVCDVLGAGLSITQAACSRALSSEADRRYIGKRFRECLSTLAVRFGYANRDAGARPP